MMKRQHGVYIDDGVLAFDASFEGCGCEFDVEVAAFEVTGHGGGEV